MPVDHGAWTVGHLKAIEAEQADVSGFSQIAERHKQGFALVDFFLAPGGSEIRFKLDQFTIDRTPTGRPYVVARGIVFD
jgi:hypothetical protein